MCSDPPPIADDYLATVGVFDGIHPGHRSILDPLVAEARSARLPAVLFTFSPRPITVFVPGSHPDELTPAPRKWRLLAEIGITRVVVLRFSREFARMEAGRFVTEILGAGRGLRGIWVGHDFRFGHDRKGDAGLLDSYGVRYRFRTVEVGPYLMEGAPVSSTRIRSALRSGAIEEAAHLLGRWPEVEGEVVAGRGEGRKLLVPTANLMLPREQCLPRRGVYAGEAEWEGSWRPAVMNLGHRPTLTDGEDLVPEVHVLDCSADLRGRTLAFRMRVRLRDEMNFPSLNALREQIASDLQVVRALASKWTLRDWDLANPWPS